MADELKGWRDIPEGGLIEEGGTAAKYFTGSWRSQRAIWHPEYCIQCLFCWIYCPDSAIIVENQKMNGVNYYHCKGCGICAKECPGKQGNKALTMDDESKYL